MAGFPGAGQAQGGGPGPEPHPALLLSPSRLKELSGRYLGTPYRLDCLGEGQGPDSDPLFTRRQADCQTLVEQVMAEAAAPAVGGLEAAVRLVRYRGGRVAIENRYHYCIPDWTENPWPARDATAAIAGSRDLLPVRRTIDLPAYLRRRGGDPRRSPVPGARPVETRCVRRDRILRVAPDRLHGTVAVWVTKRPDVVASHCGFLFNRGGRAVFRHASRTRGRVVDEPLQAYVARAPRSVVGIILLRPDLARLTGAAGGKRQRGAPEEIRARFPASGGSARRVVRSAAPGTSPRGYP